MTRRTPPELFHNSDISGSSTLTSLDMDHATTRPVHGQSPGALRDCSLPRWMTRRTARGKRRILQRECSKDSTLSGPDRLYIAATSHSTLRRLGTTSLACKTEEHPTQMYSAQTGQRLGSPHHHPETLRRSREFRSQTCQTGTNPLHRLCPRHYPLASCTNTPPVRSSSRRATTI